ncbi:unnamed protein product [Polarella glacialis]|uniref:Uncharacterized protein n=1 Tax=Polarella glacialis TaxID=89957 RepID=A0A813LJ39_POLGL|nr:unnamed protein product [Polarella glacialis]CAE8735299.1 unnamed protein product [Polarella glacialis]
MLSSTATTASTTTATTTTTDDGVHQSLQLVPECLLSMPQVRNLRSVTQYRSGRCNYTLLTLWVYTKNRVTENCSKLGRGSTRLDALLVPGSSPNMQWDRITSIKVGPVAVCDIVPVKATSV